MRQCYTVLLSLWLVIGFATFSVGNVGIGVPNPQAELDVLGTIMTSRLTLTSDARMKTQITQLTDVLDKLAHIRGVSYEWNEVYASLGRATGHREIGVIAQEIETVFP